MAIEKHILIVDDEEHARFGLGLLLSQAGFEVYDAADGLQALEQLRLRKMHMVLSDLHMPRMNGICFLKEVNRLYRGTGVIMMTSNASYGSCQEALRLGAYDYINKPLVFKELMALMHRYFLVH